MDARQVNDYRATLEAKFKNASYRTLEHAAKDIRETIAIWEYDNLDPGYLRKLYTELDYVRAAMENSDYFTLG